MFWLMIAPIFDSAAVPCWDAASEFNDSENPDAANPSGVWSYGWKKTLTDKFYLASTPYTDPPAFWLVQCERLSDDVSFLSGRPDSSTDLTPPFFRHPLEMHPGPNSEYAVLRFTAPTDGTYRVSGQFYALDDNATGTTTDVWILQNTEKPGDSGARLTITAARRRPASPARIPAQEREDLDFEVGYGANKHFTTRPAWWR